jgi:hypothetical protein
MANYSTPMPRAGWRVQSLVQGGQTVPDSSFDDEGPAVLMSPVFWLGGLASLAVWTGIWTSIAWLLDRI